MPASLTEISATPVLPSATSTEILSTPTPAPTDLPTEIPLSPTSKLGIGSTMISEKDGMTDGLRARRGIPDGQ